MVACKLPVTAAISRAVRTVLDLSAAAGAAAATIHSDDVLLYPCDNSCVERTI